MMARPIATSAAATVMTKNTNTWPSSESSWRAKATKARFAAFSINSIDMKMTSALRRTRTPINPITNTTPLKASIQESGTAIGALTARAPRTPEAWRGPVR